MGTMRWGLWGGTVGIIVGLAVTSILILREKANEERARTSADGSLIQAPYAAYAAAPAPLPVDSYITDPHLRIIAALAANQYQAGRDEDFSRILSYIHVQDDKDNILGNIVNILVKQMSDQQDDQKHDDTVPDAGVDDDNVPLLLDKTASKPQPGKNEGPSNSPPGGGVKKPAISTADKQDKNIKDVVEYNYKRILPVAEMIGNPLHRAEVLVSIAPYFSSPDPSDRLREQLYEKAEREIQEYEKSQAIIRLPWGTIWKLCWPVVLGFLGFVLVCLIKPILEAIGKGFGDAVTNNIHFQKLVDRTMNQLRLLTPGDPSMQPNNIHFQKLVDRTMNQLRLLTPGDPSMQRLGPLVVGSRTPEEASTRQSLATTNPSVETGVTEQPETGSVL